MKTWKQYIFAYVFFLFFGYMWFYFISGLDMADQIRTGMYLRDGINELWVVYAIIVTFLFIVIFIDEHRKETKNKGELNLGKQNV